MQPKTFFESELGEALAITKEPSKLKAPLKLSDLYFIEANSNDEQKFELIKQALTIYDMEEELMIKYKESN